MSRYANRNIAGACALWLCLGAPVWGQTGDASAAPEGRADAGAYLAARQAGLTSDFEQAAQYFAKALSRDPANPILLENAIAAEIGLGDLDAAAVTARRIVQAGIDSQLAHMVLMAEAARTAEWRDIFDGLESGRSVGPLMDGLAQAWGYVGLGRMSDAIARFDAIIATQSLRAFGLYHKALALASVGDFEGADQILSMTPQEGLPRTRRSAVAHAEVLSQLDRNADALDLIDGVFGTDLDPALAALREQLAADAQVPYAFVTTPEQGLAEAYLTLAGALEGEAEDVYVLFYARIAQALNPRNVDAILLSAALLERMERYDLATAAYNLVPRSDPAYFAAELGRAEALRRDGRLEAAGEVLQQLAKSHAELPVVHATLGDVLRQQGEMRAANEAYSRALDLFAQDDPARWFVLYTRAITYERLGEWPPAEADFRAALALSPGQPQVLNYLGYSMVEMQVNLDEALGMIEMAAAARPDSGAIIDSLGWVLYRLGQYEEAVVHMERASELLPVDPVINDHLGDVYWAVGRKLEARFQWQRALSFDPEDKDAARIRRKLEVGLDKVLIEEGADPIMVADEREP